MKTSNMPPELPLDETTDETLCCGGKGEEEQ